MKLTLAAALAALACASPALAQPNVVIILTDDQRADTLQYMPTVESELMAKGVMFDNAFVVNPVCCPSRASILTGRWSHSTGVWGIDGDYGGFHVFDDSSTLPVWLKVAKQGKLVRTFQSKDGKEWKEMGENEVQTQDGSAVFVGLALTSHDQSKTASAKFDNVRLTKKP